MQPQWIGDEADGDWDDVFVRKLQRQHKCTVEEARQIILDERAVMELRIRLNAQQKWETVNIAGRSELTQTGGPTNAEIDAQAAAMERELMFKRRRL